MQPVNQSEGLNLQLSNITLEAMDPATDSPLGETETKRSDDVGGETKISDQVALTRRIARPKIDVTKRRYSYQVYESPLRMVRGNLITMHSEVKRSDVVGGETKRSDVVGGETKRSSYDFRGFTRRRPKIVQTKRKNYRPLKVDPGRHRGEGLSKMGDEVEVGTATKGVMVDDQSVRI